MQGELQSYIDSVFERLSDLGSQLDNIFYAASEAEDRASDAASEISDVKRSTTSIEYYVRKAEEGLTETDVRVRAILRGLEIEEPEEIGELKALERKTRTTQREVLNGASWAQGTFSEV